MSEASPIRRSVGVLVQLAAGLTVLVVLLAGIELAAGFYLRARLRNTLKGDDAVTTALKVIAAAPDLHPVPLIADPRFLWRNKPNVRKTQPVNPRPYGRDDTWTTEVNSQGYRGVERALPPDHPGTFRILCVGDSITYGFNVDQPAPFARRLEDRLRERHPGRAFEVINSGVPGWSWIQGERFLEYEGLALRPDLVVEAHGTNDQFFDAIVTDAERLPPRAGPLQMLSRRVAARLLQTNTYRAVLHVTGGPSASTSPACARQVAEVGSCRRASVADIDAAVGAIGRVTKAANVDLLLLNLDFVETAAVQGSRRAAERDGIPLLDMVARFKVLRAETTAARSARLGLAAPAGEDASPLTEPRPRRVRLRVLVPRDGAVRAKGASYFGAPFDFDEPLYDDGTHGDEVAGDRVATTTLDVPANVPALEYRFLLDGEPEFVPLPPFPSTQGYRLVRAPGDVIAPVEVFGELFLMAERTHPDAAGHAVIGDEVLARVEAMPSFRRFLAAGVSGR